MRIAGQFLCLRHHLGNAGLLAQNNLVFIFTIVKSSFLLTIRRQSLRSKVYNCRVFYSLTMPTTGSGVLDGILDVTKELLTESNSQNLTSTETTLTGLSSKQQSTSVANTSQATDSAKGEGEARLLHKLDLLTSLVQDMVPVVKTLQEAHDASLLQDVDDDDPPLSESENEQDLRPRTEPQSDKQPSSKTTGESATDATGKVDSLVTEVTEDEVTEDEVTGPAISGKIANVLNNILASGLNEQAIKRRKENIHTDRPTNSKLLAQTRVNPEIWDIAEKQTRSMDARLQALQDTLIKGLIPLADMTGKVGESLDSGAVMPTKETLWEALSNSFLLVAAANHSLNICRRGLFKPDLDDSYKALCNNKHPIGSELFGDDLAERLKTVNESNKAAKQLTRSTKASSHKYKGPSKSFLGQGGHNQRPFNQYSHHGRGYQRSNRPSYRKEPLKTESKTTKQTVKLIIQPKVSSVPILITGRRIKNFLAKWQDITSDRTILSIVQGYKLEFYDIQPVQLGRVRPTILNTEATTALAQQIQNYLSRGIIIESQHESTEFISPVFLREKKNGSFRMILNWKEFNRFIVYHHFKMDNIESCVHLMKPGCFMASIDLSDAYFSVPVDRSHQKYLKFLWKGKLYQFTCLAQGLACAPRVFTKVLKPVYAYLRLKGHVSSGYLDDSFLEGDTSEACSSNVQDTLTLLGDLGFCPNLDKSVVQPTKVLEHLGFVLNSFDMSVSIVSAT